MKTGVRLARVSHGLVAGREGRCDGRAGAPIFHALLVSFRFEACGRFEGVTAFLTHFLMLDGLMGVGRRGGCARLLCVFLCVGALLCTRAAAARFPKVPVRCALALRLGFAYIWLPAVGICLLMMIETTTCVFCRSANLCLNALVGATPECCRRKGSWCCEFALAASLGGRWFNLVSNRATLPISQPTTQPRARETDSVAVLQSTAGRKLACSRHKLRVRVSTQTNGNGNT